ncbi:hypothetical protein A2W13_00515 [Candidatus Woesebacteria bacterium RBG_16_36_11]|uniref:HD/PDEase domain-containing protein n=3 Tax=Candidatus Woeseibacteriota TaxID=1752722 RepID=A0A1F7X755_9BACT|nr:MAG: hypothetical protein A2Z67_01270 [Candidatus Woesebacteria bacterium RBG_13_36_22]OGM10912.1 MAG: hypothetical protein A2W13_00515 [Candidatus Woesebacteria bacterium RBG_16_36_11]OGM16882.1 MAG: hypothetical protein A2V55_02910 [Candidatus Woesebacteria bacterium RBG_19FT_COMBO_37_29]
MVRERDCDPLISPEKLSDFLLQSKKASSALKIAERCHAGKFRYSGESYIEHPKEVARIIYEEWGIHSEDLICSAFLHDVVEDAKITLDQITNLFGTNVSFIVDGVSQFEAQDITHDKPLDLDKEKEYKKQIDKETLRKIFSWHYVNETVGILKLADRLHNSRTLNSVPAEKRKPKAQETLNAYVPLAEALGMWMVKRELEDLSYEHIDSKEYRDMETSIKGDSRLNEQTMAYISSTIARLLNESLVDAKVSVRINSSYATIQKIRDAVLSGKPNFRISDINDLVNYRITVKSKLECYKVLGILNDFFGKKEKNMDFSRFDEFIADPPTNNYQALQMTINSVGGAVEIAVATEDMEDFNNWGVVSLIRKGEKKLDDYKLKLVFSEDGKVRYLPRNATVIDWLYTVNPQEAASIDSVVIDDKVKLLSYVIPNASLVTVVIPHEERIAPDPILLNYCLPQTKKIIERQMDELADSKLIDLGKKNLRKILQDRGILYLEDLVESGKLKGTTTSTLKNIYRLMGLDQSENEVISWLNDKGITKDKMNVSTIEVEGKDQPHILSALTFLIQSNILLIKHIKNGGSFKLRLLIERLNENEINDLYNKLKSDPRFVNILTC